MMKLFKHLALIAALLLPVHAEAASTIWGATDRGPATGTMRFPVDINSSSTPGYLTPAEIATFFASSTNTLTNKTFDTAGTGNVFKVAGTGITAISGNTGTVATTTGTFTSTHCADFDVSGNIQDSGSGCGGGSTSISLANGLTITEGTANASPMVNGSTLWPQVVPNTYTGSHSVAAAENGGLDICNSGSALTMTLPAAGSATGFLNGDSFNFVNINTGVCTLTTATSVFNGMALVSSNIALNQYGYATCVSDGTNWNCEGTTAGTQVATAITSSSAAAFSVGLNGGTNPVFNVDDSAASQVSGVSIKGAATSVSPTITATDSGSNVGITLAGKGAGTVLLSAGTGGTINQNINASTIIGLVNNKFTFTPIGWSSNSGTHFLITNASATAITASTEVPDENFNNAAGTQQHATGALTLQRDFIVSGGVHSFAGASTATNLATMGFALPGCGTNATCTNMSGIYHASTVLTVTGTTTNSYAVNVAADTGATNNYAANFAGDITLTGAAPTVSSCGSGTLVTGSSDHKGQISGVTAATACTVTFSQALATAPACEFAGSAALAGFLISSQSTSAVTTGMTAFTGTLYYHCF